MNVRILCAATLLAALPMSAAAADEPPARSSGQSREHGGPYADIADLIERVRKKTGRQFLLDPRVRAEVPVGLLDLDQLDYARLLDILRLNQFSTYEADGLVVVTMDANARSMPIAVTSTVNPKALDAELVTVLMQAKNVCAAQTVPILRPLMPQNAHLAAMPQTNSLLLVDSAANARRIEDLFGRLDKHAAVLKLTCAEWKAPDPKAGS
jgi:general secretion pathway protein D